jgi:very-short-patch-repair endonuclease
MTSPQKQAFAEHLLENATWPERILWSRLRQKQIGYSFQRQAIVMGYIVDFWCPTARVVVELDGRVHERPEIAEADKQKDLIFAKCGIACLRFPNKDVYRGMSAVLIRIWETCNARHPLPLEPFIRATRSSRWQETVEINALRERAERKQLQEHELAFTRRYQENRSRRVGKR